MLFCFTRDKSGVYHLDSWYNTYSSSHLFSSRKFLVAIQSTRLLYTDIWLACGVFMIYEYCKMQSTVIKCRVTNQVNILHLISLFMCVFIFFIDFPSSIVSTPTSTTRRIIVGASEFQSFVYFRCCCCCFSISFDFSSLCFVSSGFCFWVCIFCFRFLGRNSLSAL